MLNQILVLTLQSLTPADFKFRSGLRFFFQLNVGSLRSKMDMLRVWAHWTDVDVIVSDDKSSTSRVISIDGYNVYRTKPKEAEVLQYLSEASSL